MTALTTRPFDEERLTKRLKSGSTDALREAYGHYGDLIYQLAYRMTHSAADASDVLQDVFVALPEAIRSFEGRGSLASWLRTVTVRTTLMKHRARRRRGEVSLFGALGALRQKPEPSPIDRLALERALADLPEDLRAVFVLKEIEGYSHLEISETLGIRRNTSEVRLFRARRMLRDHLA